MIRGYLREVEPGELDWSPPPGVRQVWVDALVVEEDWKLATEGVRCRFMVRNADGKVRSCKRPAVVMLDRGRFARTPGRRYPIWWGYCDEPGHLFGRRWVDGHLESVRVVPEDAQP